MASEHVCVPALKECVWHGGGPPYEKYTRVNLSGVNGFLNVRESQGMIKERSVIHCPHDHRRARCCSHLSEKPGSACERA